MIRGSFDRRAGPVTAAMLPVLALACAIAAPATAQDAPAGGAGGFSLPPGESRPAAPVQGPVDDQVPVIRPTRPAPPEPTPVPVETPASSASPVPAAPPAARRTAAPAPPASRAPLTPAEPAIAAPQEATPATALPADDAAASELPVTPSAPDVAPANAQPADEGATLPVWAYALFALIAAGAAAFWLLRRRNRSDLDRGDQPADSIELAPAGPSVEPPTPVAMPTATVPAAPVPIAADQAAHPVREQPDMSLSLEAHHLSRSLIYVTLAYRLTIANRGPAAIGPVRIAGDIASAHASLSREDQLRPAPGELAPCHDIARIDAGESITLTGELRMPVSAIRAIQHGAAQLFVPLARFMIQAGDAPVSTHVFVVGQTGGEPGGALRPFRIDAMPSVFRQLDQREIAAAA